MSYVLETQKSHLTSLSIPKPKACLNVSPHEDLKSKVEEAASGAALCLEKGVYEGSLVIKKPLILWGTRDSILKSSGQGTNVRILAAGTQILGLTLEGSGSRYDLKDAALYVGADHVKVKGIAVLKAVFGIVVEKANHVQVLENFILGGDKKAILGLRGDGMRFWEMRHSLIRGNEVINSRDVVSWYSHHNQIVGNTIRNGRYGTHFMYSHKNEVLKNLYEGNVVGVFIMYSRNNEFQENVMKKSRGASGYGVGIKESGHLNFWRNDFLNNTVGVYLDRAPYDLRFKNLFSQNRIQGNSIGIVFHSSPRWNTFSQNSFKNNLELIQIYGGGVATQIQWKQNHFDEYKGYDMDGDGIGDIAYEFRRLSGDLMAKYPLLAFFRGTVAFFLIDLVGQVLPLFTPQLLLRDETPSMSQAVLKLK